jgi:phosphonate transport system substrate-binding protein
MSLRSLLPLILSAIWLSACADAEVGSKQRPFTMYFVPSVDAEGIATQSKEMEDYIEKYISQGLYNKDTGFYVKSAVPTSYVSVVEALGTKKADFAAVTTFAYVLAKDVKGYDVEPIFTIARGLRIRLQHRALSCLRSFLLKEELSLVRACLLRSTTMW